MTHAMRLEQFCREELERREYSTDAGYIRAAEFAVQDAALVRQCNERLLDLVARLQSYDELRAKIKSLRVIAAKVLDEALSEGELDNLALQELAAQAGLLELRWVEAPCGEACTCVGRPDLHGYVECYRLTELGREVQNTK